MKSEEQVICFLSLGGHNASIDSYFKIQ